MGPRERSGWTAEQLRERFPKLESWEQGEASPTFKQLESFAKAAFVPIGYLFLTHPPVERAPIPDLRTVRNRQLHRPSPHLLDTIYLCQQRQSWYRDYARSTGEEPLRFVGSMRPSDRVEEAAARIRQALGFDVESRRACPTWTDALRRFIEQAERIGVLVMCSGVAGANNRRKLDPRELRGFALADDLAPVVFLNGADSKAAQMFTLAHELAHIWLGSSALSDATPESLPTDQVESWCNRVAAELLVPLDVFRDALPAGDALNATGDLARRFKVSTLVILRRLRDAGHLGRERFHAAYEAELERLRVRPASSGGDFYLTQAARVSKRFARALVASTYEGQTLYRDAFRMLGVTKERTFVELGRNLGSLS